LPQNYATQWKAARIGLAGISSGKHAAQHREKLRKRLLFELQISRSGPAELCQHFLDTKAALPSSSTLS
jgi:hypothetical protein